MEDTANVGPGKDIEFRHAGKTSSARVFNPLPPAAHSSLAPIHHLKDLNYCVAQLVYRVLQADCFLREAAQAFPHLRDVNYTRITN